MKPAFTKVNSYIFDPKAWAWNLPSGTTCPAAKLCLCVADRKTGKMKNGPHQEFKCYSATYERYPSVRKRVWANYDAVIKKSPEEVAEVLIEIMPKKAKLVRIHTGGDFFSQDYFDGWLQVVRHFPDIHFWAFTKSLPFWLARMDEIPTNLMMNASYGGKHDSLIEIHNLKSAKVVYSVKEATELGLPICVDDRLAAFSSDSFALLEKNVFKKEKENIN